MSTKKPMTLEQKKDILMKYEIASELGLMDKVLEVGWKGLTARETGKIGGIMGKRKNDLRKNDSDYYETND